MSRRRATCVFTVASLSVSAAASSALLSPLPARVRTSSSRGVSTDRSTAPDVGTRGANRSTSRRVMDGASSASPDRASWTAATSYSGVTWENFLSQYWEALDGPRDPAGWKPLPGIQGTAVTAWFIVS